MMCYPNLIPKGIKYNTEGQKTTKNKEFWGTNYSFKRKKGRIRGKFNRKVAEHNVFSNLCFIIFISEI